MDIFWVIDRKLKAHILKIVGFVKNRQDINEQLNKITTNFLTRNFFKISYFQYNVYYSCSIMFTILG